MCWGFGHSPVFKDKCYSTLAVGWGPLIQLHVLNDVMDADSTFFDDGYHILAPDAEKTMGSTQPSTPQRKEQSPSAMASQENGELLDINPFIQGAQFEAVSARQSNLESGQPLSPFDMCDLYIEKICYLSEGVLLVLTRTLEFKLFYTQKFDHGEYSAEKSAKVIMQPSRSLSGQAESSAAAALEDSQKAAERQATDVFGQRQSEVFSTQKSASCQIDGSMYANNLCESQYGQLYNQTLRVFNGMVVALGLQGALQYLHLRWDESLQEYKKVVKGNWIQLFARAIDIYTGKVKGFRDVPEEQFMRQESMKAELKLLIRTIITQQMDTWAAERAQSVPKPHLAKKKVKKPAPAPARPAIVQDDNPYAQPAPQ